MLPGDHVGGDRCHRGCVRRVSGLRRPHLVGAPAPRDAYLEVFVDEVQRYVDYYRGHGREFFERAYARKHKYWPTIEAVFSAKSIPGELGYMALVESGFNPRARSRANARGLWQFIPGTGKRYGLYRVDDFYDVRMATEAASEYLLDLIGIFGSPSFLLATAAYNAGEQRIENCLRGLDDPFEKRSFWEIRDCLARETREYVPRIMAAADGVELTDDHWQVLEFFRSYYEQYEIEPPMRALVREVAERLGGGKGSSRYLYRLFPDGPGTQACRYAGLPRPVSCI